MNSYWILSILSLTVSITSVDGQLFLTGRCPELKPLKNFNINRYLGQWYEYKRTFVLYEELGRCWKGAYFKEYDGSIGVHIDTRLKKLNIPVRLTIDITRDDPYWAPNRFKYTTRNLNLPITPLTAQYEVLDTDYENWTVEYDCTNTIGGRKVQIMVLTRHQFPYPEELWGAYRAIQKYAKVPLRMLRKSPQRNCGP